MEFVVLLSQTLDNPDIIYWLWSLFLFIFLYKAK